jgi:hypothetical protein
MSGDPLLKRLVDLSQLGFTANLTLFSNGELLSGRLISPRAYFEALASSIEQRGERKGPFGALDDIVAGAIEAESPTEGVEDEEELSEGTPEPRYIHLANVCIGVDRRPVAPFLRLRLPAVSGFWVDPLAEEEPGESG